MVHGLDAKPRTHTYTEQHAPRLDCVLQDLQPEEPRGRVLALLQHCVHAFPAAVSSFGVGWVSRLIID